MTTEDAYTCGVCGHNFKANDDIAIFADKQGRACCEYCPDEAEEEEEEVCDDEQRSYGARGAPAPESDDDEEDVDARDDCAEEEEVSECVKIREDGLGCICPLCSKGLREWDGKCYWVGVGEQKPANHPYP
jgi:hypothetical protein